MTAAIMKRLALPAVIGLFSMPISAVAQVTPFNQAVAVAASGDDALSSYYRGTNYDPLWTGADADDRERREALLAVTSKAELHGLPAGRYDARRLRATMGDATAPRDRGKLEVELSRIFLRFASDISTGILEPNEVVSNIKRSAPENDRMRPV